MELKDLILLNEVEAKVAIIKALRQELKIYIVDIAKNMPQLLSVGVLEEIRQAIPERIVITLEAPLSGQLSVGTQKLVIWTSGLHNQNTMKFLTIILNSRLVKKILMKLNEVPCIK